MTETQDRETVLAELNAKTGKTRMMTEEERKELLGDPKAKKAMDMLADEYAASLEGFRNKWRTLKVQNMYITLFVASKLGKIDGFLFKRIFTFSRREWTKRLFKWYFKSKVQFLKFNDLETIGFNIRREMLACLEKVVIYGNEYKLNVPDHFSSLEGLVRKEKEREEADRNFKRFHPFRDEFANYEEFYKSHG